LRDRQWRKSETRATALNSGDDFVDIITDNAKANVFGVLFDDSPKCCLSLLCHHVGLIKNYELEPFGK
jgi:hypothetical protein